MLQLQNISFSYTEEPLIRELNIEFHPGDFVGIMGESGSGKSTLMHLIAGRLQWQEGKIYWNEKSLPGPHEQLIPEHDEIRLIAQDFELNLYYTVRENIRNVIIHWSEEEIQEAVDFWSKRFRLHDILDQKTHDLSGGQKQRLAWIRSLVDLPDVVLLDEPTNQIDEHFSHDFLSAIHEKIKSEHKIAILVSHTSREILQWADRTLIMHKGSIERDDDPAQLYNNPENSYQANLFGINTNIKGQFYRPHQLKLEKSEKGRYIVKRCRFIGAFYEITVINDNEKIIVFQQQPISTNTKVNVQTGH